MEILRPLDHSRGRSKVKTNLEIGAAIRQARPRIPDVEIGKAVVKLRKLAKTLQKRELAAASADDAPSLVYDANTRKYYETAYRIAQGIQCGFEGHYDTPEGGWQFFLRINDGYRERLL